MKRGDVVLLDYPYADGSGSKIRPVLIVQNDRDNQRFTNERRVGITCFLVISALGVLAARFCLGTTLRRGARQLTASAPRSRDRHGQKLRRPGCAFGSGVPGNPRQAADAMILTDAGPLIAILDRGECHRQACVDCLAELTGPLLTTWPAFTEAMYLLGEAAGWKAQAGLWSLERNGDVEIADQSLEDRRRMHVVMEKYRDRPMDLANASLVILAETRGLRDLFTLDQRRATQQQVVKRPAQAVDVGSNVDVGRIDDLLRSDEVGRAQRLALTGERSVDFLLA
jgi:uncharacterized protein